MNLRVIPTGVHGVLDYLASATNLAFPGLLGLHDAPWAVLVPRIDGVAGAGTTSCHQRSTSQTPSTTATPSP